MRNKMDNLNFMEILILLLGNSLEGYLNLEKMLRNW